jgi:hypothetical protein
VNVRVLAVTAIFAALCGVSVVALARISFQLVRAELPASVRLSMVSGPRAFESSKTLAF